MFVMMRRKRSSHRNFFLLQRRAAVNPPDLRYWRFYADTLSRTREYRSPRQRYGKIPDMDVGGDMTGAHSVHGGNGKLTGPAAAESRTFWKYAYELFSH